MRVLKNQWISRRAEALTLFAAGAVVFLAGSAVMAALMDGTENALFPLGTLFLIFALGIIHLIQGGIGIVTDFNLAVSMGETRKRFIIGYLAFDGLEYLISLLLVFMLQWVEEGIGRIFYPGLSFIRVLSGKTLYIFLLSILGLMAAEVLTGALVLKFGQKVLWGLWVLAILPSFVQGIRQWEPVQMFTEALKGFFVSFSASVGVQWIPIVVILAEAVAFVAACCMLRRQRVTF
ncbi:MAG: hypothetical protein J6C37_03955 [Roseburia sp.]|nr:hypothetical protein [Roseburia sp.]